MFKSCRFCKFCYCPDLSDVSGLYCFKNKTIRIIDPDKIHDYCNDDFEFDMFRLFFGG
jgi:hypothetical protein